MDMATRGTIVARYAAATGAALVSGSVGNTAVVTLTNNSVYAGTSTKAPYTFVLAAKILVAGSPVLDVLRSIPMGPGEKKTISLPFDIPAGVYGSGTAYAALMDQAAAKVLASAVAASITVTQTLPPYPPPASLRLQYPRAAYSEYVLDQDKTFLYVTLAVNNPNSVAVTKTVKVIGHTLQWDSLGQGALTTQTLVSLLLTAPPGYSTVNIDSYDYGWSRKMNVDPGIAAADIQDSDGVVSGYAQNMGSMDPAKRGQALF